MAQAPVVVKATNEKETGGDSVSVILNISHINISTKSCNQLSTDCRIKFENGYIGKVFLWTGERVVMWVNRV